MQKLVELLGVALLLLLLDLPWLMVSAPFVGGMIMNIQDSALQMKYIPAVVVYIALAYLLLQTTTVPQAFLMGAATYAVYDFTNLATLKKYEWSFAIADTLWGGILFSLGRFILNKVY
jgi:uncharacterized membrane protein